VACAHLIDESFRANPVNRALFLRILQAPVGLVHALRRMNDMGVLGRYLPNFRASSARCSTTCSTSTRWTSTS
jgi:UTP:GlnB (protein PII) uridylyltransferase